MVCRIEIFCTSNSESEKAENNSGSDWTEGTVNAILNNFRQDYMCKVSSISLSTNNDLWQTLSHEKFRDHRFFWYILREKFSYFY